MKRTWYSLGLILCLCTVQMLSQQQTVDKVRIARPGTTKSITIQESSTLSASQGFILPATAGVVGNFLGISSVSGNDQTLSWQTVTASAAQNSDRSIDNDTTTQLIVAVDANKSYRVAAFLDMNMTGAAANDNITPTLSGPANTSYVNYGIRCVDCDNATTTGSPAFASGTTSASIVTAINPDGATDTRGSSRAYILEGLVITGSSAGDVWITLGAGSKIRLESHMVLTEIE